MALGSREAGLKLATATALAAAAAVVWGPLLGTSRRALSGTLAGAGGLLAAVAVPGLLAETGEATALGAGACVAAFLLLTAGAAFSVAGLSGRPLGGLLAGVALGTVCIASFHLGDAFFLRGGGGCSTVALEVLHHANPLSPALGDAVRVEWLNLDLMYEDHGLSRPRLSMAGDFPQVSYPAWWMGVLIHGGLGALLLGAGAWLQNGLRVSRRRT